MEAVPILAAWATPGGPLTNETYESFIEEIFKGIEEAGPLDGILLALHGAMVAESFDSADGETARRIRERVGPDLPIVMSLDMHANISQPMVDCPSATIVYRTYPHVDQRQRELECARLMNRILREGARPRRALVKLPMLIHIVRQYSEEGPMLRIFEKAGETPGAVSLMDCGDNIVGGGPGDSTILFPEVLSQGVSRSCVVLYDPESARACAEVGEGRKVSLRVGGKTDNRHGQPIAVEGEVLKISDGRFEESEPRHGGIQFLDQGLTVAVGTTDGHTVVLNSHRVMPASLHQLLSVGVKPEEHKILIVKGVTAPRAAYGPISSKVIPVDTPGVTQAGPESFEYHKRPKPLYPLEPSREVETSR